MLFSQQYLRLVIRLIKGQLSIHYFAGCIRAVTSWWLILNYFLHSIAFATVTSSISMLEIVVAIAIGDKPENVEKLLGLVESLFSSLVFQVPFHLAY